LVSMSLVDNMIMLLLLYKNTSFKTYNSNSSFCSAIPKLTNLTFFAFGKTIGSKRVGSAALSVRSVNL